MHFLFFKQRHNSHSHSNTHSHSYSYSPLLLATDQPHWGSWEFSTLLKGTLTVVIEGEESDTRSLTRALIFPAGPGTRTCNLPITSFLSYLHCPTRNIMVIQDPLLKACSMCKASPDLVFDDKCQWPDHHLFVKKHQGLPTEDSHSAQSWVAPSLIH